ncbi:urease accessory protein UreD [[Mycobacterium] nativiensis]|uniref:Urease accessory protein UreD n=1 Tax=[Mycobacterium] nativiensis TaxID=2855503 RepID=A0ABU5XXL2_9MYCO|nr:urease accessory protein UreD [Mycolicibacter sp. MYC340]MEB3032731.1 urease accessory protein UreD [Mycolicibacter sp. MYC340]
MHSRLTVIACPNRLPRIEFGGGLAARRTGPDTVHLVSAAATPLGGDVIEVRLIVESGARLMLRSAAATVVLPGAATLTSHADWQIEVAGELDIDLEPTIVAADARHACLTALHLHDGGSARLRERVQVGRSGERQGFWSGTLRVDRNHRPLLRHRLDLGAGSLSDDVLYAPRATVSEFRYPAICSTASADPRWTVLALAGGGTLSTRQDDLLTP